MSQSSQWTVDKYEMKNEMQSVQRFWIGSVYYDAKNMIHLNTYKHDTHNL